MKLSLFMIPEVGEKFNAIVKDNNKIAIGCPCTATKLETWKVYAIDSDGEVRIFNHTDFRFEKSKGDEK